MEAGLFDPVEIDEVARGVKGRRSDLLRQAVQDAKASGCSKSDVARKLGVSKRTVDRYWLRC